MTERFLEQHHLNQLGEIIQTELLKRGFVFRSRIEVREVDHGRVTFESENFQTTPVIYAENTVTNFSTSLKKSEDRDDIVEIWISVHVHHRNFNGGTNGTRLFDIEAFAMTGRDVHLKGVL